MKDKLVDSLSKNEAGIAVVHKGAGTESPVPAGQTQVICC